MPPQFRRIIFIACALASSLRAFAQLPPANAPQEFTVTAGAAFFDQTSTLGEVCQFDFGDPAGAYNHLTGYNAAHIYQTAGTYTLRLSRPGEPVAIKTIHVLPDKRAIASLGKGDNLADTLRAIPNDTVVLLPAGSTWDINGTLEIKSQNIEIRAAGQGPAPRIRRMYGPKTSNSLVVHGLNVTFRGIEFDSDHDMQTHGNAKVNIRGITADTAHLVFDQCTFRNLDDAIFCTPLTRGLLVQGCKFTDEVRSCDVWCGGSGLCLLGNTMATSQHEHNCRSSDRGFYNMLVYDNAMAATHGKECLTFRDGQDLYAAHNEFTGWVRVGPGPRGDHRPMTPEELKISFVRYVVIERNSFRGPAEYMQINEGASDVLVRYNRFDTDAVGVPIRAQGPSLRNIHLEGNYRVFTAGPSQKPIFRGWTTGPSDVSEQDSTIKTDEEAEKLKGK